MHCVTCGAVITPVKTGRPPRYCSTTCRRAAEFAIRRINAHLEKVEWRRDELRRRLALGDFPGYKRERERRRQQLETELAVLDADVVRYRVELAELLR